MYHSFEERSLLLKLRDGFIYPGVRLRIPSPVTVNLRRVRDNRLPCSQRREATLISAAF